MIGNVLDHRFRVDDIIAKSVSGGVFRGTDLTSDRTVAVKLLYVPQHADANFGMRFKRESQVLFELAHPNVVRILHAGKTSDDVLYYAMEHINGRTLEQLLQAKGRLTVAETVNIIDQVAAALDAAHNMQIVHRDVSPSNIMLENTSNGAVGDCVKLIDFGFAKDLGMEGGGDAGPATGRLRLGVAAYSPPEVLAGKTANWLSDIHGLALLTYLLLTGKHPFQRDYEIGTIGAILEEPPPPMAELCREAKVPEAVEQVVKQGLSKRPKDRPKSAGEFARQLKAASEGKAASKASAPTVQHPPRPATTLDETIRRNLGRGTTPSVRYPALPAAARSPSSWVVPTLLVATVAAAAYIFQSLFAL